MPRPLPSSPDRQADRELGTSRRTEYRQINGTIAGCLKYIKGGKRVFMDLAHQALKIDPTIQPVIEEWDECSSIARQKFDIDQICKIKGVDPFHFLGSVVEAATRMGHHVGALLAAVSHPAIVDASIQNALGPEGVVDRKMLLLHANFIPSPQGTRVQILNQQSNRVNLAESRDLPSHARTVLEVSSVLRGEDEEE